MTSGPVTEMATRHFPRRDITLRSLSHILAMRPTLPMEVG